MGCNTLVVAVLDTMWGWCGLEKEATPWFRINPDNVSGKRLYQLVGLDHTLLVTNCCKELGSSANYHGTPDPVWLENNLRQLKPDLILVCGAIAKKAFQPSFAGKAKVLYLDHPAARRWTKEKVLQAQIDIKRMLV